MGAKDLILWPALEPPSGPRERELFFFLVGGTNSSQCTVCGPVLYRFCNLAAVCPCACDGNPQTLCGGQRLLRSRPRSRSPSSKRESRASPASPGHRKGHDPRSLGLRGDLFPQPSVPEPRQATQNLAGNENLKRTFHQNGSPLWFPADILEGGATPHATWSS